MTEETGAAAPTDGQAATAPAGSEQATPNASVQTGAATENAESKAKPETGEADTGTEADTGDDAADDKPKTLTRNQRLQRKAARLSTMLAEREAELEVLRAKATTAPAAGTEPKEADYNGDYTAYLADLAAHKAAQRISDRLDERDQRSAAEKAATRRQEAVEEFSERAEELKLRIPDFDATIDSFIKAGGRLAPHVVEELQESEQGPLLAYQITKNPRLAAELNAMSPRDAAREIGRLEAKAALPNPKKTTQARPPLTTPSGGASPPVDLTSLAKSDDATAYWKARQQQNKARA